MAVEQNCLSDTLKVGNNHCPSYCALWFKPVFLLSLLLLSVGFGP